MPKDAKTRQLRNIVNREGRENASKKAPNIHRLVAASPSEEASALARGQF